MSLAPILVAAEDVWDTIEEDADENNCVPKKHSCPRFKLNMWAVTLNTFRAKVLPVFDSSCQYMLKYLCVIVYL